MAGKLLSFYNTCASAVEVEVVSRQMVCRCSSSVGNNVRSALWKVEKAKNLWDVLPHLVLSGGFCLFLCFGLLLTVSKFSSRLMYAIPAACPHGVRTLVQSGRGIQRSACFYFALLSEQAVNLWLARAYLVSCHLSPAQRERRHTL